MNYIDLTIGSLLIFGAVRGFFKGLIVEVAALAALVLGIIGALLFSTVIGDFLSTYFETITAAPAGVVFALVFIGIVVGVNLLAKGVTRLIKLAALGTLNRLLGAFFGALKYGLLISGVLLVIDQFSFVFQFFDNSLLEESILYGPIKSLGSGLFEWLLDREELIPQSLV